MPNPNPVSQIGACTLSFFFPGAGMLLVKETQPVVLGIIYLIATPVWFIFGVMTLGIGLFLLPIWWAFAVFTTWMFVSRHNGTLKKTAADRASILSDVRDQVRDEIGGGADGN